MDNKKQIKSTDWLTKNYSKEELAEMKAKADKEAEEELKQKQIEEMACEMCGNKDFCPVNPNVCISYRCNLHSAKMLLDRGYRKERQGECIDNFIERLCIKMMCTPQISRVIYEEVVSLAKEIAKEMKGE